MKKVFWFFLMLHPLFADLPPIAPPVLKKADLVALVFPASYFYHINERAQEILSQKAQWLQEQGYRVIYYPETVTPCGYLAGTDQERASALMQAWQNEEVKAIWCFRGGYGSARILDLLDYEWIKTHPKIFIGMSDITALHQAIQLNTGLITFLSPVLNFFSENEDGFDDSFALDHLQQLIVEKKSGVIPIIPGTQGFEIIRSGRACGPIVGGNLSLIAALCGTKWQLDTKNKILLLEDVGEEIYRVDRMLWQLKEAGLLEDPAAVILSSWKGCVATLENSLTLDQVFDHYFKGASYPVIKNFPSGHDRYQATIPLNALFEIDTDAMRVELLEPSVR